VCGSGGSVRLSHLLISFLLCFTVWKYSLVVACRLAYLFHCYGRFSDSHLRVGVSRCVYNYYGRMRKWLRYVKTKRIRTIWSSYKTAAVVLRRNVVQCERRYRVSAAIFCWSWMKWIMRLSEFYNMHYILVKVDRIFPELFIRSY